MHDWEGEELMDDRHDRSGSNDMAAFNDRRRVLRYASVLPLVAELPFKAVIAQEGWPVRPVRCVVPFAAGGVLDIITRILTQQVAQQIGQPVLVENRDGASGNIGTDSVLRSPADGYTWMACSPYLVTNPLLTPNTKWKTSDFVGVGLIGAPPNVFVVPTSLPVQNLRELVAYVRERPGALNVSIPAIGSSNHLGQELLFSLTGMQMQNVLYKTQSDMLPGLISGDVSMGLCTIALALPHIKEGRLRALAISAPKRSPDLPEVPTIGEAGYPDAMFLPWFGIVAASSTPAALIERMSTEVLKALASSDVAGKLHKLGAQLTPAGHTQFDRLIASEAERWSDVVRRRNLRPST